MSRVSFYYKDSQFVTSHRSELYGPADFLGEKTKLYYKTHHVLQSMSRYAVVFYIKLFQEYYLMILLFQQAVEAC